MEKISASLTFDLAGKYGFYGWDISNFVKKDDFIIIEYSFS